VIRFEGAEWLGKLLAHPADHWPCRRATHLGAALPTGRQTEEDDHGEIRGLVGLSPIPRFSERGLRGMVNCGSIGNLVRLWRRHFQGQA